MHNACEEWVGLGALEHKIAPQHTRSGTGIHLSFVTLQHVPSTQ